MKSNRKTYLYKIFPVISVLVFVAVWWLATDGLRLLPKTSLPSPTTVFKSFLNKWSDKRPDGSTLGRHILTSLQIAIYGFLAGGIIGIPLGITMAWNRKVDNIVKPLFDLVRTIPPIAWIPIMILWLGIGAKAKAGIVFLSAFIPCVINSYSGIANTNKVHLWVAQTFGASRMQMLFKVAIPSALPSMFTGLKLSLNNAWATLVAAELLGASSGLGYMMQMARMLVRPDLIVVGMLTIGTIGLLMSAILDKVEELLIKGDYHG